MRRYSAAEAERIAEECENYVHAHAQRSAKAVAMTYNEETALRALLYAIAVREREALAAAMGEAV